MKRVRNRRTVGLFGQLALACVWAAVGVAAAGEAVEDRGTTGRGINASRFFNSTNAIPAAAIQVMGGRIAGPWGIADIEPIELRPSLATIDVAGIKPEAARWFFPEVARDGAIFFLKSAGLNEAQLKIVERSELWEPADGGVYYAPEREFLLGLNVETRRRIYRRLASDERNPSQRFPYAFSANRMGEMLRQSGLGSDVTNAIGRLLYPKGESLCLADFNEVFAICGDDLEKRRFIQFLSSHSGVQLRVRLTGDSELESAVTYWAAGNPESNVRSLLESLQNSNGTAAIDAVYFLPPLARNLLMVYPAGESPDQPNTVYWNCSWTALNFFSQRPDPRFVDVPWAMDSLRRDYARVEANSFFGDVVVWNDESGNPLHMAVYIAGDVVLTKNGFDPQHPWMLMSMEQMAIRFPSDEEPRVTAYRKRRS